MILPVGDVMSAKKTRINPDSVVSGNLPNNWDFEICLTFTYPFQPLESILI